MRDLGALSEGLSLQVDPSRTGTAIHVAPGWILLAPDGRMPIDPAAPTPLLRHVSDGRAVSVEEVTS